MKNKSYLRICDFNVRDFDSMNEKECIKILKKRFQQAKDKGYKNIKFDSYSYFGGNGENTGYCLVGTK